MGFSAESEDAFVMALHEDEQAVDRVVDIIDAMHATASVESDRLMILELIKGVGLLKFNSFLQEKLRGALKIAAVKATLRDSQLRSKSDDSMPSPLALPSSLPSFTTSNRRLSSSPTPHGSG